MRFCAVSVALACMLLSTGALAEQPKLKDYRAAYDECQKNSASAGPTAMVDECAEYVANETKHEMNALYKSIHDQLQSKSPEDADEFDKAQKSWLAYRKAHCDLAGKYVGSPMFLVCPMDLDIERIDQLRQLK